MNFLPFLSRRGAVDVGIAYCFLAPYLMGFVGKGECWGSLGILCWNCSRALALYPGIRHGQVYFSVVVIPVQAYADVVVTGPIGAEGIIGFEHGF
jgi:hypothetical protein